MIKSSSEKQKEWSKKIKKFKQSGQTPEEWCSENNISMRQFNYWFRQETKKSDNIHTTKWMPVKIKQDNPVHQCLYIKIGIATVEVRPGIENSFLLDILKTLKAL